MTDQPEPYTYTDPTDPFGHTLTVVHVDADTHDGTTIPVVSLGIQVPEDATDPDNPIVYIPLADAEQVVAAIRTAAGQPHDRGASNRVTAIYDAIDAFQRQHRTGGGLGHAQIRALLAEYLDRALPATATVLPEPVAEVWVVWREDQPAHGYFATEDVAKQATIDCWEEDEPVCPDYSWRRAGPRWELVVGGECGGVYASRHRVYGAPAPVPPSADRAAILREAIAAVEDPEQRAQTSTGLGLGWEAARDVLLRRLAHEAQQPTAEPVCGNWPSPLREACTGTPDPKPSQSSQPDARRERYAAAIAKSDGVRYELLSERDRVAVRREADAVISVADGEQRNLRAELEDVRRDADYFQGWAEGNGNGLNTALADNARLRAELEQARATALTEAADQIDTKDLPQDHVDMFDNGARWATAEMRRMAQTAARPGSAPEDGAQQ
ncbi:hypothetical protein ACFRCX_30580 [Streptomyces sp. NPDC056652]|uniref:hypothetical protein n=1 Tax=Streptomyces sp. NPDC056652 TaxID=3345893 RepID=UPI0036B5BF26